MSVIEQGFPQANAVVDPKTGIVNQTWLQFFISIWNRTGGAKGLQPNAIFPVTVGVSPFTYIVPVTGHMWINQGTYVSVSITRFSDTLNYGKITRGIFPLSVGDSITITYTTLTPVLHFLPL